MNSREPTFVARAGYRLRRTIDAARFLPIVGAFMFLLPLLWSGGSTRHGIVYIFVIWFGLIVISARFSRLLREPSMDESKSVQDRV